MDRLYLGAAQIDITPEIGGHLYGYNDTTFSTSLHDGLQATAYAFRQGGTRAMMVSLTLCEVNSALCDEMRRDIERLCGIPYENIILNATHTHSGPNLMGNVGWGDVDRPYYENILRPRVSKAAQDACACEVPVKMGSASGTSLVGINRRELTVNNEVILGQNPWGCFNPEMTILSFKADDGRIVANIVHYGCHGTAAGCNHEISRDWSGVMTDRLFTLTGGFTALFNGPEGDVGPRLTNGQTTGDITYVEELGGVAAQDAVRIFSTMSGYCDVELAAGTRTVNVPRAPRLPLDEAEAILDTCRESTVNFMGQRADYCRRVIDSYKTGYVEIDSTPIEQTIVKLGGTAFVSFPYELFSEVGLRIDRASEEHVLSLSNGNGANGYFPTEDQLCRGGYEIDMFKTSGVQNFADNADFALVTETLKNLKTV